MRGESTNPVLEGVTAERELGQPDDRGYHEDCGHRAEQKPPSSMVEKRNRHRNERESQQISELREAESWIG